MKSEIRSSEHDALTKRVSKRSYKHYLVAMTIGRLRSFEEAEIRFDFPVTALVGPNGAGKTTVLGAAALIYESVKPSRFFAKSGVYDTSMRGWRVEYELLSPARGGQSVSRTASYLKAKWNRTAVDRPVKVVGISRTLPVGERRDVYKFVGGDFAGAREEVFSDGVVTAVERILGKEAVNYLRVDADAAGKYSIFAVRNPDNEKSSYSEFHFGAGEASIIRIVSEIESIEDHALILIEEIENGLHPVATQRLVEYLIEVCRRKSCQVIFTTHSNAALAALPNDAVWSAYRGKLSQGKLDVAALRTLTGEIEARLVIFTEDEFAELVCEVTLRQYGRIINREIDMGAIEIHRVGGAAPCRDHTKFNNSNPARRFQAIAFLDGDKRSQDGYGATDKDGVGPSHMVFAPGDSDPEVAIIEDLKNGIADNGRLLSKLTLALQMDSSEHRKVEEAINERYFTNADRHLFFAQVGEDLDFLSEPVAARAFVSTWANNFPDKVRKIWDSLAGELPFMIEATAVDVPSPS